MHLDVVTLGHGGGRLRGALDRALVHRRHREVGEAVGQRRCLLAAVLGEIDAGVRARSAWDPSARSRRGARARASSAWATREPPLARRPRPAPARGRPSARGCRAAQAVSVIVLHSAVASSGFAMMVGKAAVAADAMVPARFGQPFVGSAPSPVRTVQGHVRACGSEPGPARDGPVTRACRRAARAGTRSRARPRASASLVPDVVRVLAPVPRCAGPPLGRARPRRRRGVPAPLGRLPPGPRPAPPVRLAGLGLTCGGGTRPIRASSGRSTGCVPLPARSASTTRSSDAQSSSTNSTRSGARSAASLGGFPRRRPDMKRALITGITGQDGQHLAEFLLDKGYEVFGLVRGQPNPKPSDPGREPGPRAGPRRPAATSRR